MPTAPIANLPGWVRRWPGDDAPDAERMGWWDEIASAASRARKSNLANYAAGAALLIGAQVMRREIVRLRTQCKMLEQKMENPHDAVAQQLVDAVDVRVGKLVAETFAALELRVGQIQATEDAALLRIGSLAARVAELERMLAETEASPR